MQTRKQYRRKGGSGCLAVVLLMCGVGCTTSVPPSVPLSPVSYAADSRPYPQAGQEGSLWRENGPLGQLFIDSKARREGDIVTIRIVESSSASNQATTQTGRTSSFSAGVESFFNAEKDYPATHGFFNPFSRVKGDLSSDFDGNGTTSRSGDLTAYLTARVVRVLPNGNLMISGSREITVNNEKQTIVLNGTIRPVDISPENIVLSTYIADANILYSGQGVIDERQKPGWMARVFDRVWPF